MQNYSHLPINLVVSYEDTNQNYCNSNFLSNNMIFPSWRPIT